MKDQTHLAITIASTVAMDIRNGKASMKEIYPAVELLHNSAKQPINAHEIALVCPTLNHKDCEYVLHVIEEAKDTLSGSKSMFS
jgi:hypothetical protein